MKENLRPMAVAEMAFLATLAVAREAGGPPSYARKPTVQRLQRPDAAQAAGGDAMGGPGGPGASDGMGGMGGMGRRGGHRGVVRHVRGNPGRHGTGPGNDEPRRSGVPGRGPVGRRRLSAAAARDGG